MIAGTQASGARKTQQSLIGAAALRPLALLAMAVGTAVTHADPDLWGHVRFGLDMLRDGLIHSADPYSYTSDRRWINHEWLSELISAVAYQLGGPSGLVTLKGLIAIALFALVWRVVRDREPAWRWGGMTLGAFGVLPALLTVRPQLWTTIGIVIVCRVLTSSSRRSVWTLPPLFVVWSNLHGGWLVGGGLVAVWTLMAIARRDSRGWPLLAAGTCSLAATLLTPYGFGLWTFLAETVRFGRSNISEWQPIWKLGPDSIALWGATVGFIAASWWRVGRPSPETIALLSGLAIAAARVDRLGPLFGLAAVTLLARTWPRVEQRVAAAIPGRAVIDASAVCAGLAAVFIMIQAPPMCLAIDQMRGPDVVAAESLRGRTGTLVTFFDWGEYAIWHFGPALRVSVDGRRETVYSEQVLNTQLGMATGTAAGLIELARTRPEYVWLPLRSQTTRAWLREHGYREDVLTRRSFVAVRADLPPLSAWDGVESRCFPGP